MSYQDYKKQQIRLAQKQATESYKATLKKASEEGYKLSRKIEKPIKKVITGVKGAYGYRPSLSSSLLNIGAGYTATQKSAGRQTAQSGPGRPKGDYKHRDPKTGQPIPATLFYKRLRQVKREAQQQAQVVDQAQIQQLSKRGIPPEQAKQIVNQRQFQQVGVPTQIENNQVVPISIQELQRRQFLMEQIRQQQMQNPMAQSFNRPSQAVRPLWRRQNTMRYERDAFGNVRQVQGGNNPINFWN